MNNDDHDEAVERESRLLQFRGISGLDITPAGLTRTFMLGPGVTVTLTVQGDLFSGKVPLEKILKLAEVFAMLTTIERDALDHERDQASPNVTR